MTERLETKASHTINIIKTPAKKEMKAPKEEIIFQNNILSA